MQKTILITGADGLVGQAIRSIASDYNMKFIFVTRNEYDLTNQSEVNIMFDVHKPDYVIHTAARVGGIGLNLSEPAQQYYNNIIMNTLLVDGAYRAGVQKFIGFSSVCAFPGDAELLTEDILQDGKPFPAHKSYAYAKRMMQVQIEAYRSQYSIKNYCSLLPVNIFGEYDNYDLNKGHVVPSLIHKCFIAKKNNKPLEIWGTGIAKREFIYSKDLAKICLNLLNHTKDFPELIITSSEIEFSIKEIVERVTHACDYTDKIIWLEDKPNGQLRRPSKSLYFSEFFPDFKFTDIDLAIESSVNWFISNYPNVRGIK